MRKRSSAAAGTKKESLWQSICKHKGLYLMALPGFIWFVLFKYVPLVGSVIAFMDYDIYKGIGGSKFVGFKHFAHFFQFPEFGQIFRNTAILGTYDVLIVYAGSGICAYQYGQGRGRKKCGKGIGRFLPDCLIQREGADHNRGGGFQCGELSAPAVYAQIRCVYL